MRHVGKLLLSVASLVTLLLGPAAASAMPSELQRADLMRLVFPHWQETEPGRKVELQLRNQDKHWRLIAGSEHAVAALVSPLQVVRLDDGHAVVLTQAVEISDGQLQASHAASAWLGAYFFSLGADGWTLSSRIDGFDQQGFFGAVGATRIERIAPHRVVLTLQNDSCWQGFCGTWLSIYELGASSVQTLLRSTPLQASSENASEACTDLLSGKPVTEKVGYACFNVSGKYSLALGNDEEPGALRIMFSGRSQADPKAPLKPVQETLVYRYQKQGYKLISGRNPVPAF